MLPLIVLTGPTAVGKTKLSIELAKAVSGEIISADSMQVYRGMDIGTAKITEQEKEGIPHHLIDEFDPDEDFNVTVFQSRVRECIDDIVSRGHIPILVGGTGFYIQAVVNNISFEEYSDDDTSVRDRLLKEADELGADAFFSRLEKQDPVYAAVVHKNNIKKVVRALEHIELTGELFSAYNERQKKNIQPIYNTAYFVLTCDRETLYSNISKRVRIMLDQGLENEVRSLLDKGYDKKLQSMQGIGYKEMVEYIEGGCTLDEASQSIIKGTKAFAKRQLTWFKREGESLIWIDKSEFADDNKILSHMLNIIEQKNIRRL